MNTAAQSAGVLSFDEAYEVVRRYCKGILDRQNGRVEDLPLLQALGRVLAEPILADRDFPPFPRATRDGFAIRAADQDQQGTALLRVVGQVKAGDTYDLPVAPGEAVEIMTGAAVPLGADAVVMVEYTARRAASREGKPQEETSHAKTGNEDDVLGSLVEHEKDAHAEPVIEDIVEIQRGVVPGENVVPAGAEARPDRSYCRAECGCGRHRLPWRPLRGKAA